MILIHAHAATLKNGKLNAKNYPYWPELIEILPTPVIQVGTDKDAALVTDFRINLRLVAIRALIRECDYWISVDSFLPHLAQYEGKPGVVLWSVSDPVIFGYQNNLNLLKSRDYLRKDQFGHWDDVPHNPNSFMLHTDVIRRIADWRQAAK